MSNPSLLTLVERYLAERARLGFAVRKSAGNLRDFAYHVQLAGHRGPLTVEIMADWARHDQRGSADPQTWARRLKSLRTFTRWLRQFQPRTEVPNNTIFGRLSGRLAPHIYSERELADLLAAARRLSPAADLRGTLFETLFGLIASTGLRISEALALHNADVDLQHGGLIIRRTKFAKSRQVPLHLSTVRALRRYRRLRDHTGEPIKADAPFFIGVGRRQQGLPLSVGQAHRVFAQLRSQLGWRNRGVHHAPRIHDLRHTFVVRRILRWVAEGVDVDQAMLSLSTYVGHAMVTNTYWYLSAVPELMALAAARFQRCAPRQEVADA